ncbi:cell envelope biogenesis protein TolA [Bartonella taylorii]|uniref:Cell envelope biogenesis protein TolA n=1 Tax=Bartonella taylorii TaxID=33046 RepID=A0A9Q8YWM4_BARTA|nr:cell envelope biogenesis protein TolA [Bartonella taylorii]USP02299.1 cell envelope biogenesis protein TolA [Bartonella taylorii]
MNKDSYHSMKRGLVLSLAAHVIFLGLGVVHLINPISLPQKLEAVPVTLAPVSQELFSQQGALNAPVHEIPAVKPTTKPQEKEDAHHFGEGQIDSPAPFKRDEKPRPIETTPPPSGEESALEKPSPELTQQELTEAKTEVTPKVVPEVPLELQKNEEIILPQKFTPTIKKAPIEPTLAHKQMPQIALPDKSPFPQLKPKSAKKSASQNAQVEKKKNHPTTDQDIEDILAMEENNLLNRARSQGGGAKRSSKPEALGARKNLDDTTKMAQTLVSIAGGCIQQKLKLVALGGDLKNRPIVRLRFYLNREGMVIGDPIVEPLSGAESQQAIMIRQVYAAVFSCQPYTDLPRDQYDLWGQGFDFNVDPLQEITR